MLRTDLTWRFCLAALMIWSLGLPVVAQAVSGVPQTGSLIQPDTYRGLVADRRAHRVGDTLTVIIAETASASASANTGDTNGVQVGASGQTPHRTYPYAIGLSGSDTGQGETTRSGALNALLTVQVVGINPDGLLRVRGERTLVVNGEKQHIALEGLVREQDILASNIIPSSRISGAHIEFTGNGDVSEAQKRSAIYRFMKWLGLL